MGFSSILDISSFFIGMIINLIFVALMCYYFKRKYDYLYEAQCEQSKILYQLLHKPAACSLNSCNPSPTLDFTCDPLVKMSDMESDSDSDSESEGEEIEVEESKTIELKKESEDNTFHVSVEEVKLEDPIEISINLVESETPENQYSKMSMKQLKDVLTSKGIKAKTNIKKEELIELITKEVA
jgi:hypothetical protein